MKAQCEQCDKEFNASPCKVYMGIGRYCSKLCSGLSRRKRIMITCEACGRIFETHECKKERKKYCSKECKYNSKRIRQILKCSYCLKDFVLPMAQAKSRLNRGKEIYCSRKCCWKAKEKRTTVQCIVCGKTISVHLSGANRKKYCSKSCMGKAKFLGNKNPNWIGGAIQDYPENFNVRFKAMIRKRDNYKCAICGKHGLDVHHIDYIKLNTISNNCITLCRSCHAKVNRNRAHWNNYLSGVVMRRLQ